MRYGNEREQRKIWVTNNLSERRHTVPSCTKRSARLIRGV